MSGNLTDHVGTEHGPAGANARIVSLVPSLTELLFDLGLSPRLVGRTAYCTEPNDRVGAVKVVGGTKTVKMEKLLARRPTHVVVNVDETPKALADELEARGVAVIVTHPVRVADNAPLYRLLGGIFGAEREAEDLARRLDTALARIGPPPVEPARQVIYLIWKDPWMTVAADTYIADMLSLIGWRQVTGEMTGGDGKTRYPEIAFSDQLLETVDKILFSSEPYAFSDADVAEFRRNWPRHAEKARLVDGQMLSWYGSRAIEGLEYLGRLRDGT